MLNLPKQITLADISDSFDNFSVSKPKTLLDLLSEHFDISPYVPYQLEIY